MMYRQSRWCTLWQFALLLFLFVSTGHAEEGHAPLRFSYPVSDNPVFQHRDSYFVSLLKLALEKSGESYVLEPITLSAMSEKRSKLFLRSERYNVHWLLTSEELEQELLPVRIPLYKGLIGWRLLVISDEYRDKFSNITEPGALKALVATQGLGWPDTHILHSNGFSLRLAVDWSGLLEMVSKHNVDYLPLAVNEVWAEMPTLKVKNLIVEPNLALHYPSAYYFFVSKAQPEQARVLESGLRKAVSDGSFDALFYDNFGDDIERAKLEQRRIFRIDNPLLPVKTPLDDKQLWFNVSQTH
ncbi:diguanylate cyclase [Teredinibacter turnerae]|uniref:diguanylate cyclase n=1 Tax=Teredinibacter turnerae TaxID=2426 RepID=UPI001E31A972|nr:diguanylate cyclase [Teredinibacter turnerae]